MRNEMQGCKEIHPYLIIETTHSLGANKRTLCILYDNHVLNERRMFFTHALCQLY